MEKKVGEVVLYEIGEGRDSKYKIVVKAGEVEVHVIAPTWFIGRLSREILGRVLSGVIIPPVDKIHFTLAPVEKLVPVRDTDSGDGDAEV